jgi:hypothetical protein
MNISQQMDATRTQPWYHLRMAQCNSMDVNLSWTIVGLGRWGISLPFPPLVLFPFTSSLPLVSSHSTPTLLFLPLRWWSRGLSPRKSFDMSDARRWVLEHLNKNKNQHLEEPGFMTETCSPYGTHQLAASESSKRKLLCCARIFWSPCFPIFVFPPCFLLGSSWAQPEGQKAPPADW